YIYFFFFSSRRRHTRSTRDWSSDVCSSDLHKTCPIFQLQIFLNNKLPISQMLLIHNNNNNNHNNNHNKTYYNIHKIYQILQLQRSEERRVGKECRTRRSKKK